MKKLNAYFESKVDVLRIKFGETQFIETLINEEVLLFEVSKRRVGNMDSKNHD